MDYFDRLNRETREFNNKNVSYLNRSSSEIKYGSKEYWLNYYNNQTFKKNNGQYSKHY